MNTLGDLIADEIRKLGPMLFSRFMALSLYHAEFGYYRQTRDPFGRSGDFYTAEQLQPVFGRLMAAYLRELMPGNTAVVELGAGRCEMAEAFSELHYTPVDINFGKMPSGFSGIVFSNELFDAVPVDLLVLRDGRVYERRVDFKVDRFHWNDEFSSSGAEVDERVTVQETQGHRLKVLSDIAEHLSIGFIVTVDYGYTRRELVRFPEGTLMSYRRHTAIDDVLSRPGEQDITAHVDWTVLQEHGTSLGLQTVRFESLATALLRAGEPDQFQSAMQAGGESEAVRNRMQLKSLLFGMGETFRVLVQKKG